MGVYGDLIIIYPQPYSIYLRGTICVRGRGRVGMSISIYLPVQAAVDIKYRNS